MTARAGSGVADHRLIARALANQDAAAFGELVARYQSQVRTFLLRLCRDASQADDLAQDCFLHAWDKLANYRGEGSFAGWLMRIAWTTFLQTKRRADRYREVVEQLARSEPAVSVTQESAEVGDLDRMLAVLNEEERAIMILSYACGLSHREISEATDQPVGSVKSIIHRGKQKIRNHFEIPHLQHG